MASGQVQAFAGLLTTAEILNKGIKYDGTLPQPAKCEYCSTDLLYQGIVANSRVLHWLYEPVRCSCSQAEEYWRRYDAEEAEETKRREELEAQKERFSRTMRAIGDYHMRRRFTGRTFQNWEVRPENETALKTAMDYACNFKAYAGTGTGLYIEGTNGTGKTHLAAAIANQLISEEIPVICKTSIEILEGIRADFDKSGARLLRLFKTVDLLIIDDLGKEQCTEWAETMLYGIINERYEDMRPTCITTNYSEDDLLRRLTLPGGENKHIKAIISRLHETNISVPMVWEDYRSNN